MTIDGFYDLFDQVYLLSFPADFDRHIREGSVLNLIYLDFKFSNSVNGSEEDAGKIYHEVRSRQNGMTNLKSRFR